MARSFELHWQGGVGTHRPTSNPAVADVLPTTLEPADVFQAATDWFAILEGILPDTYDGSGTLKLDIYAAANTTTAADDARWQAVTEFRTPGAGESVNASNFDATPDEATMTFSTTAYSLQKVTITLTPATTPAKGDRFRILVNRDANNGAGLDDLAVSAYVTDYVLYEELP
jgi:hypothetical protein